MKIAGYTLNKETFWGPLSYIGSLVALFGFLSDRVHKWWMLDVYNIAQRAPVDVLQLRFGETNVLGFNLLMAWNKGVSYGLFASDGMTGRVILILFALALVVGLGIWLARLTTPLMGIAVGLVIGGAVGNVYDRVFFGAVADFFHVYWNSYNWYIFNIADVWIVLGVMIMVYDAFFPQGEAKKSLQENEEGLETKGKNGE